LFTIQSVDLHGAQWLIVDGYQFKKKWFKTLKHCKAKIALWTDYVQDKDLKLDLVINQNPHAKVSDCKAISREARCLAGLKYVVLREEFRERIKLRSRRDGHATRLLLTMGGADPDDITSQLLDILAEVPELEKVVLVVGANNRNASKLKEHANACKKIDFYDSVERMSAVMDSVDVAIAGAGITLWELAFMGVPTFAVILAENQVPLSEAVEEMKIGFNLGWGHELQESEVLAKLNCCMSTPERLSEMSQNGMRSIDGLGAERICKILSGSIIKTK